MIPKSEFFSFCARYHEGVEAFFYLYYTKMRNLIMQQMVEYAWEDMVKHEKLEGFKVCIKSLTCLIFGFYHHRVNPNLVYEFVARNRSMLLAEMTDCAMRYPNSCPRLYTLVMEKQYGDPTEFSILLTKKT
jgi:hypothetical protein